MAENLKTLLQVATLVAILKTARQMGVYQDLSHVVVGGQGEGVGEGQGSVAIPQELLQRAVASRTEALQVDALQLACVHPRPTTLPGTSPTPPVCPVRCCRRHIT